MIHRRHNPVHAQHALLTSPGRAAAIAHARSVFCFEQLTGVDLFISCFVVVSVFQTPPPYFLSLDYPLSPLLFLSFSVLVAAQNFLEFCPPTGVILHYLTIGDILDICQRIQQRQLIPILPRLFCSMSARPIFRLPGSTRIRFCMCRIIPCTMRLTSSRRCSRCSKIKLELSRDSFQLLITRLSSKNFPRFASKLEINRPARPAGTL